MEIDLESSEIIVEEEIDPCSSYDFKLKDQSKFGNTKVGSFQTGPSQLTHEVIETAVHENRVEFAWPTYAKNCFEAMVLRHGKEKIEIAQSRTHNITLMECKNEIVVAPKFQNRDGIPIKFEFPIIPLNVNVSPTIDKSGLSWDLSHLLNCPHIVKVELNFYLSFSNTSVFHLILSKSVEFFAYGKATLTPAEVEEDALREDVIAPCQNHFLTFNLTMFESSSNNDENHREVNIIKGIPITVNSKGNVAFDHGVDPLCLVKETSARGSKSSDLLTRGLDAIEKGLFPDNESATEFSIPSTSEDHEITIFSADLTTDETPPLSEDSTTEGMSVLFVNSTTDKIVVPIVESKTKREDNSTLLDPSNEATLPGSHTTKGPETLENDSPEEEENFEEDKNPNSVTLPDAVLTNNNGSLHSDSNVFDEMDDGNESNSTKNLNNTDQQYDSYDNYEGSDQEENQPTTTDGKNARDVFITTATQNRKDKDSNPEITQASFSGSMWFVLLGTILGIAVLLAGVFFGAATYIRIRKDSHPMAPEWESPIVKEPIQLKSNAGDEDITIINESSQLNPKYDNENTTNF